MVHNVGHRLFRKLFGGVIVDIVSTVLGERDASKPKVELSRAKVVWTRADSDFMWGVWTNETGGKVRNLMEDAIFNASISGKHTPEFIEGMAEMYQYLFTLQSEPEALQVARREAIRKIEEAKVSTIQE